MGFSTEDGLLGGLLRPGRSVVLPMTTSRRSLCGLCVLAALGSLCGSSAPTAVTEPKPLEVPLVVRETAGVARRGAPVSGGIPLPGEAGITDPAALRLVAADGVTPVECQFTVLSRWLGKPDDASTPIRWVRLDFTADVPANGTARFFLQRGETPRTPASALDVLDSDDRLIVRTGAMTVHVSKRRLTLFEEVIVEGQGAGEQAVRAVRPDPANGIVIARREGSRYYSSAALPPAVEVEERGPLVATIRLSGSLRPGTHNGAYLGQLEDLDYLIRLQFYQGRSFVRAYVRMGYADRARVDGVAGRGMPVRHEFKEIALRSRLEMAEEPRYTIGMEGAPLTGALAVGQSALVYQDSSGGPNWGPAPGWPTRFRGFAAALAPSGGAAPEPAGGPPEAGGSRLGGGLRAPGWADLSGGGRGGAPVGLTVAVRRFWQEFPTAIALTSAGEVGVGLFPGQCQAIFDLDGGRRKSREVLFYFHRGDAAAARSAAVAGDFLSPLRVAADPEWCRNAAGTDPYAIEDDELFGPYEALVRTIVSTPDGAGTRQDEREVNDNYGWLHYGDTYQGGSKTNRTWSSNPLDLSHALLIQSLRRQALSEAFFEEAAAMVRHQVDIDTYATSHDDAWLCWGTRGPDADGRTDHDAPPSLEHTGIRGVILYYYLTGEPWAREAALQWGGWVAANQVLGEEPGRLARVSDLRALGPIIEGLCELHRLTADDQYLRLAASVVKQMVVRGLSADGYLSSPAMKGTHSDAVSPPAMAEVAAAVGRYVHLQRMRRDPDVVAEKAFGEMLAFLLQKPWTRTGVRIHQRGYPSALATAWFPDDQTARYEWVAAQTLIDPLALGYLFWGDDRPAFLGGVTDAFRAAFEAPPEAVYYRQEQRAAAYDIARLIRFGQVGMFLIQDRVPRISWVPAAGNLTKGSVGPYLVRVRLRNVPTAIVPQLDYALDNTVYTGWRDMRQVPGRSGVWELEVPDLGWRRLAAHRLNYRVRLARPDRTPLDHVQYGSELIDSLDLPPLLTPRIGDVELSAGGSAMIELARHVRDNEDPTEVLTWSVADVDETLLDARVDAERQWLVLTPRRPSGTDTITVMVRDTAGNLARQAVRVTIVPN